MWFEIYRSRNLVTLGIVCLFVGGCYRSTRSATAEADGDSAEPDGTALEPDSEQATDFTDECGTAGYSLPAGAGFNCVLEEVDLNGDAVVDQRYLSVYGEDDALLYSERDENADGTLEYRSVSSYDEHAMQEWTGSDMYADGSFESVTQYRYNAAGKVLEEVRDADLDCVADRRSVYDYGDTLTQLKSVSVYKKDGSVLRVDSYFYDEFGRLVRRERDSQGDGSISARTHYTYDAASNLFSEIQDSGSDESIFEKRFYFYDEAGRLIRKDWTGRDETVTERILYYYDENGLLVFEDRFDKIGWTERVSYVYDAENRLIEEDTLRSPDVTEESVRRFSYICPFY